METINLFDGLILTIVSMLVVFIVLGAIWGLTEFIARITKEEQVVETSQPTKTVRPKPSTKDLTSTKENQKVAELMALILASEDRPNTKFEIVESKRIK